jgi:hypothetical protein
MKKEKKQLIILGSLILILVISWSVVLSTSGNDTVKRITVEDTAKTGKAQKLMVKTIFPAKINPGQLENNLIKLKENIEEVERIEESNHRKLKFGKDPFADYEKTAVTTAKSKINDQDDNVSESKNIQLPGFRVTGIIYDEVKPLAIIDDKVFAEKDTIGEYTVYHIFPEKVLVKKENTVFILSMGQDGGQAETTGLIVKASPSPSDKGKTESIVKMRDDGKNEKTEEILSKTDSTEKVTGGEKTKKRKTASEKDDVIKTVQVSSLPESYRENALEFAGLLEDKGFDNVRVEFIGGMYTVRVGTYSSVKEAENVFSKLKEISPSAFIRNAYYIQSRIIYSKGESRAYTDTFFSLRDFLAFFRQSAALFHNKFLTNTKV